MKLIFLGTGGSWPSKEAAVSATALKIPKRTLLFDCGEGTQRQLMMSSVSFMSISHIFITHYHGDHFLGLPGLIQSMALNNREDPLYIVGPDEIHDIVDEILSLGYFNLNYPVKSIEAKPKESIDLDGIVVTPFEADHTTPAVGYVVEEAPRPGKFDKEKALYLGVPEGKMFSQLQNGEKVEVEGKTIRPKDVMGPERPGRKIVFTGDTSYLQPQPYQWKECSVLVHEATFAEDCADRAKEYGHSTAKQAAEAAKKAEAERLFIVHRSPRYKDSEVLLEEAREIFPKTYAPVDLEEYDVPVKK